MATEAEVAVTAVPAAATECGKKDPPSPEEAEEQLPAGAAAAVPEAEGKEPVFSRVWVPKEPAAAEVEAPRHPPPPKPTLPEAIRCQCRRSSVYSGWTKELAPVARTANSLLRTHAKTSEDPDRARKSLEVVWVLTAAPKMALPAVLHKSMPTGKTGTRGTWRTKTSSCWKRSDSCCKNSCRK